MSAPEDQERPARSQLDECRRYSAQPITSAPHAARENTAGIARVGARAIPEIDNTPTIQLGTDAPETPAEPREPGADASSGSLVGERYLLEEEIGRGGCSVVFRARDLGAVAAREATARLVAIKLLRAEHRGSPRARARLKREFQQLVGLSHSGIVRVLDLDCDADACFISMELIAGQTVQNWMRTPRELSDVIQLTESCCAALAHAHSQGIVHGDLKPTNVMVTEEGTAKLIDFGSALSMSSDGASPLEPGAAATLIYASPQVLGGKRAEPRDDVFSLACLIYAVLTGGRHPFGGRPSLEDGRAKSAPTYLHAIPPKLFEVLKRALSAEPDRRPASVQEFSRAAAAAASLDASADAKKGCSAVPPPQAKAIVHAAGRDQSATLRVRGEGRGLPRRAWLTGSLIVLVAVIVGGTLSLRAGTQRPVVHAAALLPAIVTPAAAESIPESSTVAAVPEEVKVFPAVSGLVSFETPTVEASAAQSLVAITVKRSHSTSGPGTFMWRVMRGSAEPGVDYEEGKPEVARFVEGQTVRTLFIPLLNTTVQGMAGHRPRSFTVVLERPSGGLALGRFARVTVTIDPLPEVPGWQRSSVYQVRADQR
jgi:Protein kinase domain